MTITANGGPLNGLVRQYPLSLIAAIVVVGVLILALVILPDSPNRDRVLSALVPAFLVLLNLIRTEHADRQLVHVTTKVDRAAQKVEEAAAVTPAFADSIASLHAATNRTTELLTRTEKVVEKLNGHTNGGTA